MGAFRVNILSVNADTPRVAWAAAWTKGAFHARAQLPKEVEPSTPP